MTLPVPAVVTQAEIYEPFLRYLRDTLVPPKTLAERWALSEDHLSNMRRRNLGLPWLRLPNGKEPEPGKQPRGAIRYRLSDLVRAELLGTSGHITWARLELFLATCTEIPEPQRAALIAKARAAFG